MARLLHRAASRGVALEYAGRLLASAARPGVRARVLGVLRWQRLLDAVLAPAGPPA